MRDRRSSKTKIWIKYVRTTDSQHEVSAAHQLFRGFLNPALDLFEDSLAIDWGDQPAQNDELYFIHKAQESKRADKCSYLDPTLVIQPDGKIGACCWDYNLDISAGGFGDLREAGLLEIWRGQKRDAFRTNFKTGLNLPAKCASCIVIHDRIPVPPEIAKVDERYLVSTLATGFLYNFAGQA